MAKIPFNTYTTKNVIENAPDKREWPGRSYLSMSAIGKECTRSLFYSFRWCSVKIISVQKERIFERGNLEEKRIISSLTQNGMTVFRKDGDLQIPMTGDVGETQEELTACHGHVHGHPDGRVLGVIESPKTVHLLEMKALKESYFKKMAKEGLKRAFPTYYGQITRYMAVMKLDRTLFVTTNKNNEERDYQRYEFDKSHNEELERKEFSIVSAESPEQFEKFSRAYIECKWCEHYDVCHNEIAPVISCRSCKYCDLATGGKWLCSLRDNKELSTKEQEKACNSYKRAF